MIYPAGAVAISMPKSVILLTVHTPENSSVRDKKARAYGSCCGDDSNTFGGDGVCGESWDATE